ncbi:hypothetical protein [Weizmannia phage Youna2]
MTIGNTYVAKKSIGPFEEGGVYTAFFWGTLWFRDEVQSEDFMFPAPRFNVLLTKGYFEEIPG